MKSIGYDKPESTDTERPRIDLSGEWEFQMDPDNMGCKERWHGRTLEDRIMLPGTMETNEKGEPAPEDKRNPNGLTRRWTYTGAAWYRKTIVIAGSWSNSSVQLEFERTKPTEVWIDGKRLTGQESLSTPQYYDLGQLLNPGTHTIAIRIDNTPSLVPVGASHAIANCTQGNWNGIIGDIALIAIPKVFLSNLKIARIPGENKVSVNAEVTNHTGTAISGKLRLNANGWNGNPHTADQEVYEFESDDESTVLALTYDLGSQAQRWDEFTPNLYYLNAALSARADNESVTDHSRECFGLCDFQVDGTQFVVNGNRVILRGKHDACVFPLTGHPPMSVDGWLDYMLTCKDYGFNHVRCHSWCPPEAAFLAADIAGIYIQPELPNWKGFDRQERKHISYMEQEGCDILAAYANHPCFTMFALGNELGGDRKVMAELLGVYKKAHPHINFAQGSNNYFWDPAHQESEDFFVSIRNASRVDGFANDLCASFSFADCPEGGIINAQHPNTRRDFSTAVSQVAVPSIGHETGQFQIYPDFDEIKKYTGVMAPRNFELFRERLDEKGLLHLAKDYFEESGRHAVNCYRDNIEICMRTPGFGGFQLLDLQDFPGQGTALVGILDAFMESKGLIEPAAWRQFCDAQTLQIKMDTFVWDNSKVFRGDVVVINYGASKLDGTVKWALVNESNSAIVEGEAPCISSQGEITTAVTIEIPLGDLCVPAQYSLRVNYCELETTYPLWVYPNHQPNSTESHVTHSLDEALERLERGEHVLLVPDHNDIEDISIPGLFITDYWCYPMFRGICERNGKTPSPGTLGLLIDCEHPVFKSFPTNSHSDWQWWSIVKNSRSMILDDSPQDFLPVVQSIDNFERNHKLGILFECQVGNGKLLVCTTDFDKAKDAVAKQYFKALCNYVGSEDFSPRNQLSSEEFRSLLSPKTTIIEDEFEDSSDRTDGYNSLA
jgi:hypothetical protein